MTKSEARSVGGIAWKLKVGQPHTVDKDLIGADFSGGFEAGGAGGSNIIILIDTITANAKASYKNAIPVKSRAAGKKKQFHFYLRWADRAEIPGYKDSANPAGTNCRRDH